MHAWLDENCGADGWAMTPTGLRGVVNDVVAMYFLDATLASAFCRAMVRRDKGRDNRGGVQGSRPDEAGGESWSRIASDALIDRRLSDIGPRHQ